ncbi:hypothetical protein E2C01_037008 [Portunus trituberculatus]|uniref:Uncharacterized protein n=1 Tax=Portunus trituberculatus TaxID=210409 RepID=A0A5B7FE05_PORTR|nr:hypothetical protein [Portunus trituberculatus]
MLPECGQNRTELWRKEKENEASSEVPIPNESQINYLKLEASLGALPSYTPLVPSSAPNPASLPQPWNTFPGNTQS